MKLQQETKVVYYRLITLWILCEAMLGGILHGAKIPATGLLVGSCAVICISLIAYYAPAKGSILKATLIVAIFKMMLSPQATPPAYFAVFFQGLLGEALFWHRKQYPLSCLLFGVVVLLESGIQRIVILTMVYSNDLWQTINTFINSLTGQTTLTNYSFFFAAGYVLSHIIMGVFVGFWIGKFPQKIRTWTVINKDFLLTTNINNEKNVEINSSKKKKLKNGTMVIWLVLLLLYVQSVSNIGPPLIPGNIAIRILIRSLLIILTYYFVVGPLLIGVMNKWLKSKKIKEHELIQTIQQYLPDTKELVAKSWQLAAKKTGIKRILFCGEIILFNTLSYD